MLTHDELFSFLFHFVKQSLRPLWSASVMQFHELEADESLTHFCREESLKIASDFATKFALRGIIRATYDNLNLITA